MYRWYKDAALCYAYLSDVPNLTDDYWHHFDNSQWFKRGWTLQELLAPREVTFYSKQWQRIGTKSEQHERISGITGISEEYLLQEETILNASVAARMSWAAPRNTTRTEDTAYCLLGIFDVNMTLLYGEGVKAFIRLQEEILKEIDDQSILAWSPADAEPRGVLARSPKDFAGCGHISGHSKYFAQEPMSMTSRGLRIHLPFMRHDDQLIAFLTCEDSYTSDCLSIVLDSYLGNLEPDELLSRAQHHPLTRIPWASTAQGSIDWCTVFIEKTQRNQDNRHDYLSYRHHFDIRLRFGQDSPLQSSKITAWSPEVLVVPQDDDKQRVQLNPLRSKKGHAMIVLTQKEGGHLCVAVGFENRECGVVNTESYWAGVISEGLNSALVEEEIQRRRKATGIQYTTNYDEMGVRLRYCWEVFLDKQMRTKVAENTLTELKISGFKASVKILIQREKGLGSIAHGVYIE
jgi:hypothetical protein